MIDNLQDQERRAFLIWLRTGRMPASRPDVVELKFNPWHDPEDGRFTFANAGRYFAGGVGSGGGGRAGDSRSERTFQTSRSTRSVSSAAGSAKLRSQQERSRAGWLGGGFTGGGGGSSGGGGASGGWSPAGVKPQRRNSGSSVGSTAIQSLGGRSNAQVLTRPPTSPAIEKLRSVERNGYTYQIDARGRTRQVSGSLTMATAPVRSRSAQARAGGVDRRQPCDDGGHYIAARFNGPTEAFNHFAQDANFNRGGYRLLEEQWAKAKSAGQRVAVKIVPHFTGSSNCPSALDVLFTINGHEESQRFPNERVEKPRGKR